MNKYSPPDEALWREMKDAFAALAVPLAAHMQIQEILMKVEERAKIAASRAALGMAAGEAIVAESQ